MSKICRQCNLKHHNYATSCVHCGSELEVTRPTKIIRRTLISVIITATLISAVVFSVTYFTGPKAAVRKIMRAYKSNDVQAVVDCFPDFLTESLGDSRAEVEKSMTDSTKRASRYLFSYQITNTASPHAREREELLQSFESLEEHGFDESKLEDIKIVWTKMTGKIRGFLTTSRGRFIAIKYGGQWYCWPDS